MEDVVVVVVVRVARIDVEGTFGMGSVGDEVVDDS